VVCLLRVIQPKTCTYVLSPCVCYMACPRRALWFPCPNKSVYHVATLCCMLKGDSEGNLFPDSCHFVCLRSTYSLWHLHVSPNVVSCVFNIFTSLSGWLAGFNRIYFTTRFVSSRTLTRPACVCGPSQPEVPILYVLMGCLPFARIEKEMHRSAL
jgi:hypothetical protein